MVPLGRLIPAIPLPGIGSGGAFLWLIFWSGDTMRKQYAVLNVGSQELLSDWVDTRAEADAIAAECEQHETQPHCNIIERDEVEILRAWCREHRGYYVILHHHGPSCDGWYPEVDSEGYLTGEIVDAQDTRYRIDDASGCAVREETEQ